MRRRFLRAVALALSLAVGAPFFGTTTAPGTVATSAIDVRPNIVLVMLDDASLSLVQSMSSARRMTRDGASYPHSYVVDSLCCVSRSSFFTGQYPHQTGVLTNGANLPNPFGPQGGWSAFHAYGNEQRAFNTQLQASGYATGFVGKYLNEFEIKGPAAPLPTPPGWTRFMPIFGGAYDGWNFLWSDSVDGAPLVAQTVPAPAPPVSDAVRDQAHVSTLIDAKALEFISIHQRQGTPFFLEIAAYAPHNTLGKPFYPGDPFFPALMRDRPGHRKPAGNCGPISCLSLTTKDLPGFADKRGDNRPRRADGTLARPWQPRGGLPAAEATRLLRDQARMVQSVDRLLQQILDTVDANTYVVLTSDNGLHLGQVGMVLGKGTAYRTDVRVPLLVTGPGVAPGPRKGLTSNIDLASTFEELAGLRPQPYRSGTSLVPSFADRAQSRQRYAFTEHTWTGNHDGDPDLVDRELLAIPSYVAVRDRSSLLIRLDVDNRPGQTRYVWEFYDYTDVAWERTNGYAKPRYRQQVKVLKAKLRQFDHCASLRGDAVLPAECIQLTS